MVKKHLYGHIFGIDCAHEAKIGLKISFCVLVHHVKSEHDISKHKITRKENVKNPGTLLETVSLKYAHSALTSA